MTFGEELRPGVGFPVLLEDVVELCIHTSFPLQGKGLIWKEQRYRSSFAENVAGDKGWSSLENTAGSCWSCRCLLG